MRGGREGERYVVGWRLGGGLGSVHAIETTWMHTIPCRVAGRRLLVLGAVFEN